MEKLKFSYFLGGWGVRQSIVGHNLSIVPAPDYT
jgi:hypothetical protein